MYYWIFFLNMISVIFFQKRNFPASTAPGNSVGKSDNKKSMIYFFVCRIHYPPL